MKKQTVIKVDSKKMNVDEFRKKYVTLGKQKDIYEKQLKKYAKEFLEKNYSTNLTVPIKISGRLTSTGGYFQYRRLHGNEKQPIKIDISERFIASAIHDGKEGLEAILDVLHHELVHYALCKQGKKFHDGDEDFESELARLDIGASGATNKKLVKSKKVNTWYEVIDIYERKVFNITRNKEEIMKTYKKHAKKPTRNNRVGYEVVKTYF